MSPINVNPGAGGARAHGISKSDAVSITRNQRTEQENASIAATAILNKALELGIHVFVAPDQNEKLILIAPLSVPRNVRRLFEHWLNEFRSEIVDIIAAENAGGRA